jgi:hypothetical protein
MHTPTLAVDQPTARIWWDSDDTDAPLIWGSQTGWLPQESVIEMVTDSSGKRVSEAHPQLRWGTSWLGRPALDGKVDPDAVYRIVRPRAGKLPASLWTYGECA